MIQFQNNLEFSNTVNGFHIKVTFTHLDTQKTPKTSDSLKPTPHKSHKSPEIRQISAKPLGQDWVRCTNDDLTRLTRGGQKSVEITCKDSNIHVTCS